jgi:hypothetical protein
VIRRMTGVRFPERRRPLLADALGIAGLWAPWHRRTQGTVTPDAAPCQSDAENAKHNLALSAGK